MQLIFNQNAISRTITREQWREIHRWRRETSKRLLGKSIEIGVLPVLVNAQAIRKAVCLVMEPIAG